LVLHTRTSQRCQEAIATTLGVTTSILDHQNYTNNRSPSERERCVCADGDLGGPIGTTVGAAAQAELEIQNT